MSSEQIKQDFQRELRESLEIIETPEGNTVDAVTFRIKKNRRDGAIFRERAETALGRRHKLTSFLRNEEAMLFYYRSSFCFQLCGRWQDAGDSLICCAKLLKRQGLHGQAGAVYTEAAENYMRSDLEEASRTYALSVSAYADEGRFDIAGKIEYLIGNIQFHNKHWEDAITHYKRASNYLQGEQLLDINDVCIEKTAQCYLELSDYASAFDMYLACARNSVKSNLKRFNAKAYLLKCIFCLFAQPEHEGEYEAKYHFILEQSAAMEQVDFLWRTSKESLFVVNIVDACLNADLDAFADHVYYWNNVKPLDKLSIRLLKVPKDDILMEIQRLREFEAKEIEDRIAEERRIEEEKKRKEELRVLGIKEEDVPAPVVDDYATATKEKATSVKKSSAVVPNKKQVIT